MRVTYPTQYTMAKLIINRERLELWCAENNVENIPNIYIVQHIPVNCGKEPFGDYTDWEHQIRIRRLGTSRQELKRMNVTLFHELRHHMQAQVMTAFYIEGGKGVYKNRPIEKDARSYAQRAMRKYKPLIEVVR